jgi:hypothetical protein
VSLESKIDDLYRLPLSEFTGARNALAKTVSGPEAKRVRALGKPTVVPWAVNQLFWKARHVYERLMKSGEALRKAQLAALSGSRSKPADLQRAADAHRKALAEALKQAKALAESAGSRPDPDALSRTLESMSLAPERPQHPGRLTDLVRPAGFEALFNVPIGGVRAPAPEKAATEESKERESPGDQDAADRKRERERERELAAERRRVAAAVEVAEGEIERATAAEARAREASEDADRDLERAKAVEKKAREAHERAEQALATAKAELAAARKSFSDLE